MAPSSKMGSKVFARTATVLAFVIVDVAAQDGALLGSIACPNGHSDCAGVGTSPHYCAFYQNTAECWPCIFCTFFEDSIDGSCDVCGTANTDGGEAPGESEVAPTTAPTPAPSVRSTTAAASTTPTCPRNCGTPDRGGGECNLDPTHRNFLRCTSCNDDRVFMRGICYQSLACTGRRVQTGARAGEPCGCSQAECHYCNIDITGETCRICRDGWYLLGDQCVESCPANMAQSGINLFKRRCEEPFTCIGGRIENSTVSYGCKCPNADNSGISSCHICEFRAGEFGQRCLRCKSGQFLHEEQCIDACPDEPNLISYIPGSWSRECRAPFTCTDNSDEQGRACKCSPALRSAGCQSCRWDASGATCLD